MENVYKVLFSIEIMKCFEKKRLFLVIFLGVMLISLALAADYSLESVNIGNQFSTGELISGNIVMSFFNQSDANFSSNFGGGISLLDLLALSNKITGVDYNCVPESCESVFEAITGTGQTSKNIDLPNEEVYGFRVSGSEVTIEEFSLKVEGDTGTSCKNQLGIDLLNDGKIDFFNDVYVNESCSVKDWGCFEEGVTDDAIISTAKYCQKMDLPAAPAYMVGARVNEGSTTGRLTMSLYDFNDETFLAECEIDGGNGLIGCIANHSSLEEFEAFVCIEASAGTDYEIRTETDEPCGMTGVNPSADFQADYEIYAQTMKYGEINTTLDEEMFEKLNTEGETLVDDILQDYIDEVYGTDCSDGCIIPFKVMGSSGSVNLNSLNLRYMRSGALIQSDDIYNVEETSQKISVSNITLDVSKMGFRTPDNEGLEEFTISFDGEEIVSKNINITKGFEFDIRPKSAVLKLATSFRVIGGNNLTNAVWDFGDDSLSKTGLSVNHVYSSAGNYDVEVEVSDNTGQSSKRVFSVNVKDAKTSAEELIGQYKQRLPNVSAQLDDFDDFSKRVLEKTLNLSNAQSKLDALEVRFAAATNESEYLDILTELLELNIPEDIAISLSGNLPFAAGFNNINVLHIEEISEENIDDDNALRNAIISWYDSNYNGNIAYEVISTFEEGVKEDILVKTSLSLNSKNGEEQSYLIIDYPIGNIEFKEDYLQQSTLSGTYLPIDAGFSGNIDLIIEDSVTLSELGMYLSPEISQLTIVGDIGEPGEIPTEYPTGFLLASLAVLIGMTLAVYIFLQEWYKRKYESYLFKNKDDLFNLINFISNGRKAKLDDKKITDKLDKAGWSKEQIKYAFKKIDGKRTGMYEIPVFKFFEQMRIKKEIEKRDNSVKKAPAASSSQGQMPSGTNKYGQNSTKFIKRPKL